LLSNIIISHQVIIHERYFYMIYKEKCISSWYVYLYHDKPSLIHSIMHGETNNIS